MPSRPRTLLASLVAASIGLSGAWAAVAESGSLTGGTDPPTTAPSLLDPGSGDPGTAPPPPPPSDGPAKPTPGPPPPSDGGGGSGDDAGPAHPANEVPPAYRRLIASVRRTPANSTRRLVETLSALQQYGLTLQQAAIVGMGRFPIAGVAQFSDDWWFPRFVPAFHLHVGTDIFAAFGTPVRAPVDGVFMTTNGRVGGLAAYVTMRDGTYFYLAHLSALAAGLTPGQRVTTGQVIGYVGDSGNARGGTPHVHFEIHPRGGPPINPKPYLDRFVTDALRQVPLIVEHFRRAAARSAAPVPPPTVVPAPIPPVAPDFAQGPTAGAPLLWAASMNPASGLLGMAEAAVAAVAAGLDWDALAAASDDEVARAGRRAAGLLVRGLTPAPLAALLPLA